MMTFLEYPFMVRALISAVLIGGVCGLSGAYVVLKKLSFLSEGIGHASVLSIAAAILLQISPITCCFLFAILFSILLATLARKTRISEDAAIGVLFSTCLALGVLLLSSKPMFQGDITRLLFGDLLTITNAEVISTALIAVCVTSLFFLFSRVFKILLFDEQYAQQLGIPTHRITALLYSLISISIIASIRLVGALLVTSLLVVPASICLSHSRSFASLSIRSSALGVAICVAGVVLSYLVDTPPGATIVLCAGTLFGVHTFLFAKKA